MFANIDELIGDDNNLEDSEESIKYQEFKQI